MSITVRTLVAGALRLIGVGVENEALTSQQEQTGLFALNGMIDAWSIEKLMIYTINRNTFALSIGVASYTLGSGGDLNIERPTFIENASILLTTPTPNIEIPIKIWSDEEWRDVTIKTLSSAFPIGIYAQGDYPLNVVYVWPVPTAACSLVLYTPGVLSSFATINTSVSLPKGYERALRYNLAVELAPEYGLEPSPGVQRIAAISKSALEARNWTPQLMQAERAFLTNNVMGSMVIKSQGLVVD